jgi:hypothetical protein
MRLSFLELLGWEGYELATMRLSFLELLGWDGYELAKFFI